MVTVGENRRSEYAKICATPGFSAVTTPELETDAMSSSKLRQLTTGPVITTPSRSLSTAGRLRRLTDRQRRCRHADLDGLHRDDGDGRSQREAAVRHTAYQIVNRTRSAP